MESKSKKKTGTDGLLVLYLGYLCWSSNFLFGYRLLSKEYDLRIKRIRMTVQRYTTGDAVLIAGEKWFVRKTEWVWKPWTDIENYCQRLDIIQFDDNGEICNEWTGIRNTDIEGFFPNKEEN